MIRMLVAGLILMLTGCQDGPALDNQPQVPRGYYAQLEIIHNGQQQTFGPFVGYYFKPVKPDNLEHLSFICFNERGFYTDQLHDGALLFTGDAVLTTLPDSQTRPYPEQRINPVFFESAPREWLASRPEPQEEYVHFHSAYNSQGAVLTGYWLRHRAKQPFTYNMGGRLNERSPLFHLASPDQPENFPHIIEFDFGPDGN